MPGITHWQHPSFFAYFPSITNFESILADMYATSVSNPGFNVSLASSTSPLAKDFRWTVELFSGVYRAGDGRDGLGSKAVWLGSDLSRELGRRWRDHSGMLSNIP